MSQPTFIAVNQTASPIQLVQLARLIPSSGNVSLSDYNLTHEVQSDRQLFDLIVAGDVLINDGISTLTKNQSLQYMSQLASIVDLTKAATPTAPGYMSSASASSLVRLTVSNVVHVSMSGGDFSSVAAAVSSITTATSTNQYVIEVAPGVYTEPPFTLKPYVHIHGSGMRIDSVIKTNNNSADFITAVAGSSVSHITINGPTGAGFSAISYADNSFLPMFLDQVVIRSGYYGINVHPSSYGTVHCHFVVNQYDGSVITEFLRVTNGNAMLWDCAVMGRPVVGAVLTGFKVVGPSSTLTLDGATFGGDGAVDALYVDDGASARLTACVLADSENGIHIGSNGSGTTVNASACTIEDCATYDILIESSTAKMSFIGSAHHNKMLIAQGAVFTGLSCDDTVGDVSTSMFGRLHIGDVPSKMFPASDFIEALKTTGLYEGGGIQKTTGTDVLVLSGSGFVTDQVNDNVNIRWDSTPLTLPLNTEIIWIGVNNSNVVTSSLTQPDTTRFLILGVATTTDMIPFLATHGQQIPQISSRLYKYAADVVGPINISGCVCTVSGSSSLKLSVDQGSFYIYNLFKQASANSPISYCLCRRNGGGVGNGWNRDIGFTDINTTQYDNNSGSLDTLPSGSWRRDVLYLTANDTETEYHLIMGQQPFANKVDATLNPILPNGMAENAMRVASIVVQSGSLSIDDSNIIDQRPKLGQFAATISGITRHGDLSGLSADDHTQYQLRSEKNSANGYAGLNSLQKISVSNLQFASGSAVDIDAASASVGTGTDIARQDHRHRVLVGSPISIGTTNSNGVLDTLSRADHLHAHDIQTDGTLHSLATTGSNGFMSSTDKTAVDLFKSGDFNVRARVKNNAVYTLLKGRAVAVVGWDSVGDTKLVDYGDKDVGSLRPAIGVVDEDILSGSSGFAVIAGVVSGVDTSTFSLTDQLVLGNNGHLIRPPPDNSPFTGEVQNIASTTKIDSTTGRIIVSLDGQLPVTADQIFALEGTSGTPSPTNHYVTDSDSRLSNDRLTTGIRTLTTVVSMSNSPAPIVGQVLTAISSTSGSWQTPTQLSSTAPLIVDRSVSLTGTGSTSSRSDHKHDVLTDIPSSLFIGSTISEGSSGSLARSDHQHAVTSGTPSTIGTSNSSGVALTFTRSDHVHDHGAQSDGTLHAAAVAGSPGTPGFITGTDQQRLNSMGVLTSTAPESVTKASASVGVSTEASRADHKHDVSTTVPGSSTPGDTATEGSATSLARSDHRHSLPSFGTAVGTFCQGNDSRLSNDRTASSIRTLSTIVDVSSAAAPSPGQALVATSTTTATWTSIVSLASTTPLDVTKSTALIGSGSTAARVDHKHDISTDVAVTVGSSNTEGVSISLSRADHLHSHGSQTDGTMHAVAVSGSPGTAGFISGVNQLKLDGISPGATNTPLASTTPLDVTKSTALIGSGSTAARVDHKHDISTAVPGTISIGDTATEGTATSLARSDHRHTLTSPTAPTDVTKFTASAGSSSNVARQDHKHDVSTSTASAIAPGGSSSEGSSTSLARSDHLHSLPSYGSTAGTFCQGNDSRLSDDRIAYAIQSSTSIVYVSSSLAPTANQSLVATSGTTASWQTVLASSSPADVTKSTSSVGTATDMARSDHKHDISTTVVGASTPGDTAAEGTATSLSRSDHRHSLPSYGSTAATICQGNDVRLSDDRAASGFRTATNIVSISAASAPSIGQALVSTSVSLATWQTVAIVTSSAPSNVTKSAAVVGIATDAARSDHKHDVTTASVGANPPGTVNAEGTATSLARSDHSHALASFGSTSGTLCQGNDSRLSDDRTASGLRSSTTIVSISSATAPVLGQSLVATGPTAATWQTVSLLTSVSPSNVTKSAAVVGVGTAAAREDHKHDVTTAAAVANPPGSANAEGTATSLSRSDHTHTLAAFGTTSGTFCQGNDSRLSDDRTASDLRTATTIVSVSAATAPTAGQALVATGPTVATWQNFPIVTHVDISSATTTASTTDVLMASMTATPAAGTYMVWFSGDIKNNSNARTMTMSIYVNGALYTGSERANVIAQSADIHNFICMTHVTVNGSQAIEGRWRTSAGTATNTNRQLYYMKVG